LILKNKAVKQIFSYDNQLSKHRNSRRKMQNYTLH